jgi:pimeloyl-ACP methyl ester carboxylesterase
MTGDVTAQTDDAFFDSNGVRIHYIDQGKGTPIVLLHGNDSSLQNWVEAGVVENLSKDHRVIAFDLRHFGFSDRPRDPKQYGTEMGLDAIRLLDHLKIEKAHFVGYSLGAVILAQLVTVRPERFLTATLGGHAGYMQPVVDRQALEREYESIALEIEKLGISRTWYPQMTDERFKQASEGALANPARDRFARAAYTRGSVDFFITEARAAAVTVPTLGIVGTNDPSRETFQRLKALRPSLNLVEIQGAEHTGQQGAMRHPEFVQAVRQFIAGEMRQK